MIPGPSVVFVSGLSDHSTRYRCCHPVEQLGLFGIPTATFHCSQTGAIDRALRTASILVLHRVAHGKPVERLVRDVERGGGVVLFDCDDAILDEAAALAPGRTAGMNVLRRRLYRDELRRYRISAERSSALLVSTAAVPALAGRKAWVHRNAFSVELQSLSESARSSRKEHSSVVIGYSSGTATHDRDLESVVEPLTEILDRHSGTELWLAGSIAPPARIASKRRVRRHPPVPWTELPPVLSQFDINLAPLDLSDPFNQSKSEVKYVEAALVGIPTIASPTEAFRHAIRPGENGLLAETPLDWRCHLQSLIEDQAFRRRLGERAREDVLQRYGPVARARELVATLNEAGLRFSGRPFWPQLPAEESAENPAGGCPRPSIPPLPRRAWYVARSRGLLLCAVGALNYVRERLLP